jgi:hypothetical protein
LLLCRTAFCPITGFHAPLVRCGHRVDAAPPFPEARGEAVERAGDMLVRGDAEGHVVWLRIYRAIIELQLPPTRTKH